MEWTDGSKLTYTGWLLGEDRVSKAQHPEHLCMGLQLKMSPTQKLPSSLYWAYQKCSNMGGYVCKKSRKDNTLIQNQTITGVEGRLTSPNYPNQYSPNVNYWIKIIAPEKSRIVVQFQKIDLEEQPECLYDYVSVEDANYSKDFEAKNEEIYFQSDRSSSDFFNSENFAVFKKANMFEKQSQTEAANVNLNVALPSFQPYVRWCGSHEGDMTQFDFVSNSNEILFHFFTDSSTAAEGFSAVWRSIDISACPGQTFTSREGVLISPNFPHFLLHNLNCSYTIQAPLGRKIWIEFNHYNLEKDADLNVDLGNGVILQPFGETNIIGDGVYLSSYEKVTITLRTGSNPIGQGFKLTYRTSNALLIKISHIVLNLKGDVCI